MGTQQIDGTRQIIPGTVTGGGGALVLLESRTASASASLDFTTRNATGQSGATFQSDFDEYVFEFLNLIPGTTAVDFGARLSTNGGSSYDSSSLYTNAIWVWNDSASAVTGQAPAAPTTRMLVRNAAEINTDSTYGVCGTMKLFSPRSTALHKRIHGDYSFMIGTGTHVLQGVIARHVYRSITAVDAMQFAFTSGNIASGTIRLYGVAK